jgi:hypothetical protein
MFMVFQMPHSVSLLTNANDTIIKESHNSFQFHSNFAPVQKTANKSTNSYTAVMERYRRQRAERSEKTGVLGSIPQEVR